MSYQGKRPDQIQSSKKILFFTYIGLIITVLIAVIIKYL
jgi:hypothetical protein